MADDDNNTGAEATPGPARKKATKKKAARKKTTKKVAARAAAADSEPMPAEAPRPPQPAPREPAPHQSDAAMHEMHGHGDDAEEAGISGWLVMWGPLIIVGFLILVFMGDDRDIESMAAAPPPQAEPAEPSLPAPVSAAPAVEVTPEQAAADLAEAFKAAGIPLPTADPSPAESGSGAAEQPGVPPELQGNPWAPAAGQPPAAAVPPPPGYGYPYGHHPYAAGYPPPVYHPYGAPPPGYYGYGGWALPPAYGAMPHMPPGYMGQGHMGEGHMGQGAGYGPGMMQPAEPSQDAEGDVPPPPSSPSN